MFMDLELLMKGIQLLFSTHSFSACSILFEFLKKTMECWKANIPMFVFQLSRALTDITRHLCSPLDYVDCVLIPDLCTQANWAQHEGQTNTAPVTCKLCI